MRWLAGCVVFVAACDPGWKIEGTVVDPSGAPIAGATVSISCPGAGTGAGPVGQSTPTDATGKFQFGGVSGAQNADKCTVTIAKSGFATKSVAATDVCCRSTNARNFGTPCKPSDRVTLSP